MNDIFQLVDWAHENGWALLVVLLPLAYVFGVPLLTLFTFRSEANPVFERVEEDVEFPEEVAHHFEIARAHFARLGFDELDTFYMPHQMENVKAILRVFVNRSEKDAAMAVVMYGLIGDQWKLQTKYVEICTQYHDGTEIDTLNTRSIGAFPIPPSKTQIVVPWITDIPELYHAHQTICRFVAHGTTKELKLDTVYNGNIAANLRDDMIDEFEQARAVGYVRYAAVEDPKEPAASVDNPYRSPDSAPKGAQYVATIKGAYMMTWNELWPFKTLIRGGRFRRARRLLAEAGWSEGSPR